MQKKGDEKMTPIILVQITLGKKYIGRWLRVLYKILRNYSGIQNFIDH